MKNNAPLIYSICLIIGDSLAVISAFIVAFILRVHVSTVPTSAAVRSHTYLLALTSLLPFWILFFTLLGLYTSRYYNNRFSEFGRLLVGSFVGVLFLISYSYIANVTIFPARLVTFYGFGLAFCFTLLFRTVARGIRRELFTYGVGINDVLIVGDTRLTHELLDSLGDTAATGYRVRGVVGGVKHPLRTNVDYPLYKSFTEAIGYVNQLHTIIQTELYADVNRNDEILNFAQKQHIAYRFVPGNNELFTGNIDVEVFHSIPMIAVNQTALIGWGRVVKRLFDIVVAGVALILASPFMLIIAVLVKLSDGGPVLFRHERLTRYDDTVRIFKFRSNNVKYNGLEPEAAFAKMGRPDLLQEYRANGDKLPVDPRVTSIGRFIRKYSLDELPQLFNILHGDISLVGPRALVAYELEKYPQKNLILSVKSGLTGLAQISGRSDITFEERRKLDLYYVQNWSFWGDIVILIKTFWIVLFHKGAR